MLRRLVLGIIAACATATVAPQGATYVVNPQGTGDFPTIVEALAAAEGGDRIELADGVFEGPGNHNLDFNGKAIIVCSQSGDPTTCIIDCQGSEAEPHRGFIFQNDEGAESVLIGFTVTQLIFHLPLRCGPFARVWHDNLFFSNN